LSVPRKDSVYPFEGRTKEATVGDEGGEHYVDVKDRLRALEESTGRIEQLLLKLCSDIESPPRSESASNPPGETGTLQDLDKSGTADIDG
jgi:hypothetical protein